MFQHVRTRDQQTQNVSDEGKRERRRGKKREEKTNVCAMVSICPTHLRDTIPVLSTKSLAAGNTSASVALSTGNGTDDLPVIVLKKEN